MHCRSTRAFPHLFEVSFGPNEAGGTLGERGKVQEGRMGTVRVE